MRGAIVLVVLGIAAGCGGDEITGTTCTSDASCNLFNVRGTCEPTGFCSYPDAACSDGRRYGPGAGDLANTCLGTAITVPCGGPNQPCCGATCGPDLACAIEAGAESGTCQCGGSGEPCCGGTSCDASLVCDTGRCGAADGVVDVAIGKGTICALRASGVVQCWGLDVTWSDHVQGHNIPTINTLTPTAVANLSGVVEIRSGELHSCARKTDGTLWCWGHNENNKLGDGTGVSTNLSAIQVPGLTEVSLFDTGRHHSCALGSYMGAPGLWCWGRNGAKGLRSIAQLLPNMGRLGNGTNTEVNTPVAVDLAAATAQGQTVKSVSTGAFHSCVVMSDNKVWCWGRNSAGALGNGTTTDSMAPVATDLAGLAPAIPNGATIDEVVCNDSRNTTQSTCLRLSTGSVYCWGDGSSGELGDGTTQIRNAPTARVNLGALGSANAVALASAGNNHCARSSAGTVACWGSAKKGLLGHGLTGNQNFATPTLALVSGATKLVMGHRTACVIDDQQRLSCWGNNQVGQILKRTPAPDEIAVRAPVQVLP